MSYPSQVPGDRARLLGSVVLWSFFGTAFLPAASITWDAAVDTTVPADVITDGTLIEAINAGAAAGVTTVNGVTFPGLRRDPP